MTEQIFTEQIFLDYAERICRQTAERGMGIRMVYRWPDGRVLAVSITPQRHGLVATDDALRTAASAWHELADAQRELVEVSRARLLRETAFNDRLNRAFLQFVDYGLAALPRLLGIPLSGIPRTSGAKKPGVITPLRRYAGPDPEDVYPAKEKDTEGMGHSENPDDGPEGQDEHPKGTSQ